MSEISYLLGRFDGYCHRQKKFLKQSLTVEEILQLGKDEERQIILWPQGERVLANVLFEHGTSPKDVAALYELLQGCDDAERGLVKVVWMVLNGAVIGALSRRDLASFRPFLYWIPIDWAGRFASALSPRQPGCWRIDALPIGDRVWVLLIPH